MYAFLHILKGAVLVSDEGSTFSLCYIIVFWELLGLESVRKRKESSEIIGT